MIKVSHLYKKFKQQEVLHDISFEVAQGKVLVIIGPSGSGKSTLLRCLNLLEKPNEGMIELDGTVVDVHKLKKADINLLRSKTAMVFQNYSLYRNKTALQNITLPLIVGRKINKQEAVRIAEKQLADVGLSDKAGSYPAMLSGGQQQRVGIARALALNPSVILFDEPTSALDPERVGEVLKVIKDLARKKITMIIVTHEISFARDIADKVIFMADGQIVEEGDSKEIFHDPKHERTRRFLNQFLNEASNYMI